MALAIGIDLGTSNSCVAVHQKGRVEIIANDQGNRTTPSYVAFTETGRLIGDAAKQQVARNPKNTIYNVKRLIGRKFNDESVQKDMKYWSFDVVSYDEKPMINVDYKGEKKLFFPEEISAMVLTKMKETSESYLGGEVKDAVITVPAYFNNLQRQATIDAGNIAGLNVLRIINEPSAAAIAYILDKNLKEEMNVLVFDLGGGTLDVSVLTIENLLFEVRSTVGDTHLGGEDFDNRLVRYFKDEFQRKYRMDLSGNVRALYRLRTACERAKRILSTNKEASIEIDSLFNDKDFYTKICRERFEELCADLFMATMKHVKEALEYAKINKSDINEIVLVGGSTRIPKLQKMLQELMDGKDLNKSINPDEVVAYGAAVHAAVLTGVVKDIILLDVTPLSLGTETIDGSMLKLIRHNSSIPTKSAHTFTTFVDIQPTDILKVFEGERPLVENNNLVGTFEVKSISPMSKIDIWFDIDSNGILRLTGQINQIRISNNKSNLSKEFIQRMINDAEKYNDEDKKEQERIRARNELEEVTLQYQEAAQAVQEKCDDVLKWLEQNTLAEKEEFTHMLDDLQSAARSKFH